MPVVMDTMYEGMQGADHRHILRKAAMSIKVMSYVWDHSPHKGSELVMLLAIADHANDHGEGFPSIPTLAKKTRMTERNVQFVLKKLEASQDLLIRRNAGPHGCHKFQIVMHPHTGEKISGEKFSYGQMLNEISEEKQEVTGDMGEKISPERISGRKDFGVKSSVLLQPQISPEPSLEPSEDLRYSLTTFESYPDSVSDAHMSGMASTLSPLVTASSTKKATKGGKTPAPICEDEWPGLRTLLETFELPLAFLDDNEWWNDLSYTCTPTNAWLERQFAKIHAWLNENPSKSPRSARGWKRFLRTWLERAYEYERRRPYATQKNSR